MKILIVAKTRQGSGACIGGITFDGQSVRLIAAEAATNEHAGLEYQVGEVWEVDAVPAGHVIPPHVENIVVRSKRRLGEMSGCAAFVEQRMPPKIGGPELLYEGLSQVSPAGALYIAERTGIPPYSTTFWRPDQPLARVEDGKRIRYRYPTAERGRTLVFVGFQDPPELIPADTLLRVSLAHWWRPSQDAGAELRCYVQLSGWFLEDLPSSGQSPTADANTRSSASSTPSLDDASRLLKTVFGYDTFRPLQAEIVAALLAGQDVSAVMPTGSGKSLCYQTQY